MPTMLIEPPVAYTEGGSKLIPIIFIIFNNIPEVQIAVFHFKAALTIIENGIAPFICPICGK